MWGATSEAQAVVMFTNTATIVSEHRSHLIHESHARYLAGHAADAGRGGVGRPFKPLLDAVGPRVSEWEHLRPPLSSREDPACLLLAPVAPGLTACADRDYGREELMRTAVEVVRHLVTTKR